MIKVTLNADKYNSLVQQFTDVWSAIPQNRFAEDAKRSRDFNEFYGISDRRLSMEFGYPGKPMKILGADFYFETEEAAIMFNLRHL